MDNIADQPGPTLEKGIEEVWLQVKKAHNGVAELKSIITDVCAEDYYSPPDGWNGDNYKGSFCSMMGWIGCGGFGKKDTLVKKVVQKRYSF